MYKLCLKFQFILKVGKNLKKFGLKRTWVEFYKGGRFHINGCFYVLK